MPFNDFNLASSSNIDYSQMLLCLVTGQDMASCEKEGIAIVTIPASCSCC